MFEMEEMKNDIKMKSKSSVKALNRKIIANANTKENLINIKQKTTNEEYIENDSTAQVYAENKVIRQSKKISKKAKDKYIKTGKKSVKKTGEKITENIRKRKEKKKNYEPKGTSIFDDKLKKNINVKESVSKENPIKIKTKDNVLKHSPIKQNSNTRRKKYVVKNLIKGAKVVVKNLVQVIKKLIKVVIKVVKAIFTAVNAIIAIVFISVIVVLVMIFTGGASAIINSSSFFGTDVEIDDEDVYFTTNSFVLIAQSQVGNVGGQPYWSWYGFDERVSWCACFVSWCADQCGLIEQEIVPKYASCNEGIKWYKKNSRWADRSGYRPVSRRYNIF